MNPHSISAIREQFRAVGKFHTPPELALRLRSLIPNEPRNVYDPTCGAGALLAVFHPDTPKFGQDIDEPALSDAEQLPNFTGAHGDVLTDPAWPDKKFHAIVANPPFSIKWVPNHLDERFINAPTVPTQSRADFAFLMHIIHALDQDGTAAVLNAPGVLFRGGREQQLRQWFVEELNIVDAIIAVPGDAFEDTSIPTVIIVFKKNRAPNAPILMRDDEHDIEREVPIEEIAQEDFMLSPSRFVSPKVESEWADYDAVGAEVQLREMALANLEKSLQFSAMSIPLLGAPPLDDHLDALQRVIDKYRKEVANAPAAD